MKEYCNNKLVNKSRIKKVILGILIYIIGVVIYTGITVPPKDIYWGIGLFMYTIGVLLYIFENKIRKIYQKIPVLYRR